jgi:sulfur carrier protein ThiS
MTVTLRALGHLKTYLHNQPEVCVEAGRSIRETLSAAGIPPEVAALVLVNEEHRDKDYVLQDGDILRVMAVIGGG